MYNGLFWKQTPRDSFTPEFAWIRHRDTATLDDGISRIQVCVVNIHKYINEGLSNTDTSQIRYDLENVSFYVFPCICAHTQIGVDVGVQSIFNNSLCLLYVRRMAAIPVMVQFCCFMHKGKWSCDLSI